MIFKCTAAELDEVTAFYDEVTAYLQGHINYPKWTPGEYPGKESVRAASDAGTQYAMREDGEIIGAFVLNGDPQGDYDAGQWEKPLRTGEYYVLHALAVKPGLYRRGAARKMVQYCIDAAKNGGKRALRLDVVPDNLPARRLYESMGFVFAGEHDLKRGIKEIPLFALYGMDF